jgi:hypothetical protein
MSRIGDAIWKRCPVLPYCRKHWRWRKGRDWRKWREGRECRRSSRYRNRWVRRTGSRSRSRGRRRRRRRRRRTIVASRPDMAQGLELFCGFLHLGGILDLVLWLYRRNGPRGGRGICRSRGAAL